ncbi:glucose-6-phosphate isomerase [candidate division KSB1 bacterium]|nr:MAG: glucose-6-phosphate isomerase [candidate division KSB1 bacterium]
MEIKFDFNNFMAEFIGNKNGISESEVNNFKNKAKKIHKDLMEKREKGELPFFDLPYQDKLAEEIEKTADDISKRFDYFIVLGIGGSALGGIALHTAINHPYYNQLSNEKRNFRPKIYFLDNIDPVFISSIFDVIDLEKSCFNVISKSGGTAETASQFLIFLNKLKNTLGNASYKKHIITTTDAKKGKLREITDKEGFLNFVIPAGVGGRFSVFTPVGLLPSAITGIDIKELLKGAAEMDKKCQNENIWENPAYLNAIFHYIFDIEKQKNISVMMPYSNSLKDIADWYRQLWAESLGKKFNLKNEIVNTGQTPVKALGVTDQHSQLQLYVEGPDDKVITFLTVDNYKSIMEIPLEYKEIKDISYLSGHTLNELIKAERDATELTLTKNHKPNCNIIFPEVNEYTVGQILYMFEVQTAFAGGLYNINPFDQPGVEEGKHFAYGILGRKGFEHKKEEIEKRTPKKDKWVI